MTRASDLARLIGAGATINDGTTITTADNTAQLELVSTDADSSSGPNLVLNRDSSSPADGDNIGLISFKAENDVGGSRTYAQIQGKINDQSEGSIDAELEILTLVGDSSRSRLEILPTEIVFNEDAQALNFRVESNSNSNMLFVDGGNNFVGIGTTDANPGNNSGGSDVGVVLDNNGKVIASASGAECSVLNRQSSFGAVLQMRKDGSGGGFIAVFEDSSAGRLLLGNDNTCLLFNDSAKQIIPFNSVGSKQDNVIDLGNASGRFGDLFAANSSINTSDRNEKQDIEELSDAEKRVAIVAKGLMRKFKWKDAVAKKGDKARTHFGIIAQDLQDAFTAEGLDATKYGMFCSDTFWDNDEVYIDDDGKEHKIVKSYYTEKEAPEGSTKRTRLAVRYSELLAFIISAI